VKHILVVDDDKTNLVAAKQALSDVYKVTAVTSGKDALKFLEKNTCDLILLDINMPEMDGFEVITRIKENENCAHIPVFFLTGDNNAETESRCLEAGAYDFIVKPFVQNVMFSRIERTLELEEMRRLLSEQLKETMQEMSDIKGKSQMDALTSLWNREYTKEQVEQHIKDERYGTLFMIDMDNFKAINDQYGHQAGDDTLLMFAETMKTYAKEDDILCRIGGDEFVMFITGVKDKGEISNLASNIISDICYKLEEKKFETNTSVSIGIALAPEDGEDFDAIYNAADKALYHVKQNGKNSFHYYSEQRSIEKNRSERLINLDYIKDMMERKDSGNGAYLLTLESFLHVYNFVRRLVERSGKDAQSVLFTIDDTDLDKVDDEEKEIALEMLEKAIFTSLRRVDISTRYSDKQVLAILLDANADSAGMVASRILDNFEKMYTGGKVHFTYEFAAVKL